MVLTTALQECQPSKDGSVSRRRSRNLTTTILTFELPKESSAIQHAAQDSLEASDLTSTVLSKTTSSGLVKYLAQNKKAILLSPEVTDLPNKLMKSDEGNATGDVQLLGKLFSGERCSYHYFLLLNGRHKTHTI